MATTPAQIDQLAQSASALNADSADFGRSASDAGAHISELVRNSVDQIASINQFYSALIGKKVRAKRLARVERGEWNGGPAPYGYTSEAGRLIVVAEEARVVRQIFDLWLEHPSPAEVRNRLEALGIRDRQGRVWSSSVLHYMIQNRTYVGEVRHHDIVRPGLHEALVPREVWDAAQKLLATRTRLAPSTYKRAYPLKGLLRCGRCGVGMKAHWAQGRNKIRHPRYRCERTFKRDWSGCPIKELRAEPIEAWVQGQLDALRLRPELIETILAGVNAASGERVRPLRDKERVIEARMAEVGSQIDNLVGAIASGGSGFQSIRSALLLAERNKEQLATERDALKRQIEREAGEPIDPARVRGNLEDFQLLYGAATDEERGELLRLLIKEIVVEPAEETGPGRKIAIHFWATVNLPRGGSIYRQNWLPELGSNQRPTD